jgi:hypothetical protein
MQKVKRPGVRDEEAGLFIKIPVEYCSALLGG